MSPRSVLITGANGFVGAHVARIAAEMGVRVVAVSREAEPNTRLAPYCDRFVSRDLAESWDIDEPADAIVHLAGLAAVGPSFDEPQRYISVNSGIATHMFESLLEQGHHPRVVIVSSGAVYAPPQGDEGWISEETAPQATSPYAVAKLTVEAQGAYYASRGLDTVVARPFNHIGPGQGNGFLIPDIADALRLLPPGEALHAGNLTTARDYTDVRDVARAYLELAFARTHRHPVYNVASGQAHTGMDVVAATCRILGRPVPSIEVDPAKIRPTDIPVIRGDASRLRTEFGWSPAIDWERSIADYLDEI